MRENPKLVGPNLAVAETKTNDTSGSHTNIRGGLAGVESRSFVVSSPGVGQVWYTQYSSQVTSH